MSSREDNYSRCVRRNIHGKEMVYQTLGKAKCDATQKCIVDTCSHQTLEDIHPELAAENPYLKACVVEYGKKARTGRRSSLGLRSIRKAALCGLDPKIAAKKIQRSSRKNKAEKTKSPKPDARQGDGAVRGVRVHRLQPLQGGPRGRPVLPPLQGGPRGPPALPPHRSRSRSSSNTRAAKTIQHIWRNKDLINAIKSLPPHLQPIYSRLLLPKNENGPKLFEKCCNWIGSKGRAKTDAPGDKPKKVYTRMDSDLRDLISSIIEKRFFRIKEGQKPNKSEQKSIDMIRNIIVCRLLICNITSRKMLEADFDTHGVDVFLTVNLKTPGQPERRGFDNWGDPSLPVPTFPKKWEELIQVVLVDLRKYFFETTNKRNPLPCKGWSMTQCNDLPHCRYTRNKKTKCRKLSLRDRLVEQEKEIKVEKKLDKKTKKSKSSDRSRSRSRSSSRKSDDYVDLASCDRHDSTILFDSLDSVKSYPVTIDGLEIEVSYHPSKVIRLSNGRCYLIDELAYYIITQKVNICPFSELGTKEPLWNDREELLRIRDFPYINPLFVPFLHDTIDRLIQEIDRPSFIEAMEEHPEVWQQIGTAGYLCLSDYTDNDVAYKKEAGEFLLGMDSLSLLNHGLDSIPEKYKNLYREVTNNAGNTLGSVLGASDANCIHGIGTMLLHFYFKMYRAILDYYEKDREKTKIWRGLAMGGIYDTTIKISELDINAIQNDYKKNELNILIERLGLQPPRRTRHKSVVKETLVKMLLTEAENRSHTYKVFFFVHETINKGIEKHDGSLTMVNNYICERDIDGQYLGDQNANLTLMMYNPNLCLQPGKLIRLGYLNIQYPSIKEKGSGLSQSWRAIFNAVRKLQGKIVDQLRKWRDEDTHDHLCRYFLDDDSPLLQPFDVSSPEIGIQLARIVVELGHFFKDKNGLQPSDTTNYKKLLTKYNKLVEHLDIFIKNNDNRGLSSRKTMGESSHQLGYPFNRINVRKDAPFWYREQDLFGIYTNEARKIMPFIRENWSAFNDAVIQSVSSHDNHLFYQVERLMVYNIMTQYKEEKAKVEGELTPIRNSRSRSSSSSRSSESKKIELLEKLTRECSLDSDLISSDDFSDLSLNELRNLVKIKAGEGYNCYRPSSLYQLWKSRVETKQPFTDPISRIEITEEQKRDILQKHKKLGAPRREWEAPEPKTRKFNKGAVTFHVEDYYPDLDFLTELWKSDNADVVTRIEKNILRKIDSTHPQAQILKRYGESLPEIVKLLKFQYIKEDDEDDGQKKQKIRDTYTVQYFSEDGQDFPMPFLRISIKIVGEPDILVGYIPANIDTTDTGNSYDTTFSIITAISELFNRDDRALLTRHYPNSDITCCTVDLPKSIAEWYDYDDTLDDPIRVEKEKIKEFSRQIKEAREIGNSPMIEKLTAHKKNLTDKIKPGSEFMKEVTETNKNRWGLINYNLFNRVATSVRTAIDLDNYTNDPVD